MDESLARMIAVIYAVAIPSVAGLIAYGMMLRDRRRRDALRNTEVDELRRAIEELQERLDFAERTLLQGRSRPAIEPKKSPVP
jgi:hypothetical protein